MPFYFALPRSGNTGTQRRQTTGRDEFVRTAPTNLTFSSLRNTTRGNAFLEKNLHLPILSAIAGAKSGTFDKGFTSDATCRLLYTQVENDAIPHLTLPRMSLQFPNLTDSQRERLESLSMEERTVKGKGKVWVGSLSTTAAREVVEFGVSEKYAAMGGTVSTRGLTGYNAFIRIITLAAQGLSLINDKNKDATIYTVDSGANAKIDMVRFKASDLSPVKNREKESNPTYTDVHTQTTTVMARKALPAIYTDVSGISKVTPQGIFCPFEPNYSGTDKRAAHVLLSDFQCIACEPDDFDNFDKNLVDIWTEELCFTMEGEFLAHMIACLSLCKRVGGCISFLVTGNLYEGALIFGAKDFSFKLVGGKVYESIGGEDLVKDIERYAFHAATVRGILEIAGIGEDVDPSNLRSMRQLRAIIFGRTGGNLTPAQEGEIAKKLLFLNFREKPETVHPESIRRFLSFIDPSPTPIPENVFMDRRAFFSRTPVESALSMFGFYAPSPILSGMTFTLAVPPSSQKKISTEPKSIQFAIKDLSVAAKDWEGFIRGGSIVQPGIKARRARYFSGTDKTKIWGAMTALAGSGVQAKAAEQASKKSAGIEERKKRDREQGEDDSIGGEPKVPKLDFSAFESRMEI